MIVDGAIYIIGGYNGKTNYLNDLWKSSNGFSREKLASNAQFAARAKHSSVTIDGIIYLIGGHNNTTNFQDVWVSVDGSMWIQLQTTTEIPAGIDYNSVVIDKKILVMASGISGIINTLNQNQGSSLKAYLKNNLNFK